MGNGLWFPHSVKDPIKLDGTQSMAAPGSSLIYVQREVEVST